VYAVGEATGGDEEIEIAREDRVTTGDDSPILTLIDPNH
jgi:hypothetical protein